MWSMARIGSTGLGRHFFDLSYLQRFLYSGDLAGTFISDKRCFQMRAISFVCADNS